jgi:mono/diheme cytochrome c family protein
MKKDVKTFSPDDAEPTVHHGAIYFPMWLVGILGFLLYWGCNYVDNYGGNFSHLVYAPYLTTNELARVKPGGGDEAMTVGQQQYRLLCVACHQENGGGQAGQFPPLAGSDWVLAEGPNRLIRLIHTGVQGPMTVNGQAYNGAMPPMGAGLDDKQLAALVTYIRNSWGNQASKVTADQVKAVRADMGGRTDPHTADELLKLPVQ